MKQNIARIFQYVFLFLINNYCLSSQGAFNHFRCSFSNENSTSGILIFVNTIQQIQMKHAIVKQYHI